jgi:hypothetical protein
MIEEVLGVIYENVAGPVGLGHLVWCPVPHLEEVPRILEVERASSETHYASKFEVVQLNSNHFKERRKLPIKSLSLQDTEELLISKTKKRPCIVVASHNTAFTDAAVANEVKGRKHLQDDSMLLAPIYGTATLEDTKGFPPKMVARIRVFLYNQFFYLPRICPKNKIGIGKDGIVRLDRLMPASPNRGVVSMGIKLADEPLALLMALLRERFGAPEQENLKIVREILADSLPEECRPKAV